MPTQFSLDCFSLFCQGMTEMERKQKYLKDLLIAPDYRSSSHSWHWKSEYEVLQVTAVVFVIFGLLDRIWIKDFLWWITAY